jgi:hypothetical protein
MTVTIMSQSLLRLPLLQTGGKIIRIEKSKCRDKEMRINQREFP